MGNGIHCVKWHVVFQDLSLKRSWLGKTKGVKMSTAIQIKKVKLKERFFTFQISLLGHGYSWFQL